MQKINYGLIISDFDGTLVSNDSTICEENKKAIAKYREKGGKFAISTGRLPNGIVSRAQELGLKGAVACGQGSVIVDIESKEILFENYLPKHVALKICRKLEEMDLHTHMYSVWEYYCNKDDEALKMYQFHTKTTPVLVLDRSMYSVLEEKNIPVCKFIVMVEPKDAPYVIEELEKAEFEGCIITKSAEYLIEVVNASTSKGTAVEFLSKYYKVPIEKTIGIGDQWNDIPMVETAGLGVAVQNGNERLKAEADYVCERTNEQGAIAEVIDKFGFTE
jgi:Cof subfamily protein (haloacid dehalogenase superfamily)